MCYNSSDWDQLASLAVKPLTLLLLCAILLRVPLVQAGYLLAEEGQSCSDACLAVSLNCDPHVVPANASASEVYELFSNLSVNCTPDSRYVAQLPEQIDL